MTTVDTTTRRHLTPSGIAGQVSIALAIIGNVIYPIWLFPSTSASPAHLLAFVTDHTAQLKAMMLLYSVTVVLWLVFGAQVTTRLRATLPTDSTLPACFSSGLAALVTLLLAGFTCFDVAIYRHTDATETKLLYDLAFGLLAMSGLPTAVALIAFALSVHRYGTFAHSAGLIAAMAGAAHVLLLLSFVFGNGILSLESATMITGIPTLLFLWIGQTSATLKA